MAKEAFDLSQHPYTTSDSKPSRLLEAQFYLSEIDRREANIERQEDRRIASRSHFMEWTIIGMIGLEIIIALVAIWLGFRERASGDPGTYRKGGDAGRKHELRSSLEIRHDTNP